MTGRLLNGEVDIINYYNQCLFNKFWLKDLISNDITEKQGNINTIIKKIAIRTIIWGEGSFPNSFRLNKVTKDKLHQFN